MQKLIFLIWLSLMVVSSWSLHCRRQEKRHVALVLLLIREASSGFFFVPECQSESYSWCCRKSVWWRKNCRWLEAADELPVRMAAINTARACRRISPPPVPLLPLETGCFVKGETGPLHCFHSALLDLSHILIFKTNNITNCKIPNKRPL